MKIEDQVCTLKQAKKLKILKVTQDSYFQWKCNDVQVCVVQKEMTDMIDRSLPLLNKNYAAYTLSELGVMLELDDDKHLFDYFYNGHAGCYEVVLNKRDERKTAGIKLINREEGETEAEARADMLIYLLENKLTTAEEVNKRLTT